MYIAKGLGGVSPQADWRGPPVWDGRSVRAGLWSKSCLVWVENTGLEGNMDVHKEGLGINLDVM